MATRLKESTCPGCRLRMPHSPAAAYSGYYHCSPECWTVYGEILGFEFTNLLVFNQVHQLTVDSYALQHAGGPHPDKSIGVHLCGLYMALEAGIGQRQIPSRLNRLATDRKDWPHFPPPASGGPLNVFDIAIATTPHEHITRVTKWARFQWSAWSDYHAEVAALVAPLLQKERR